MILFRIGQGSRPLLPIGWTNLQILRRHIWPKMRSSKSAKMRSSRVVRANATVAKVLVLNAASSVTVESEGRRMKKFWITYISSLKNIWSLSIPTLLQKSKTSAEKRRINHKYNLSAYFSHNPQPARHFSFWYKIEGASENFKNLSRLFFWSGPVHFF